MSPLHEPPRHPGEFLVMALKAMEMTQAELSRRTGLSAKHVNFVCNGKVTLTPYVAVLLEEVLGVPAEHWVRLQGAYDLAVAREARQDELEAEKARREALKARIQRDEIAWCEKPLSGAELDELVGEIQRRRPG